MLKVVIVGNGEMASSLLLGVKEAGHKVVGIFRSERKDVNPFLLFLKDLFAPTDFYMLAKSQGIPEIKAKSVNSEYFRREIRRLQADVVLVATWGEKFLPKTISTPRLCTVNCHPSLLPKHRGPNPYMSVLWQGEEKTGVTFHLMDKNFDTGPILYQQEVPVLFSDTGYTLKLRCVQNARQSLAHLLNGIENATLAPQNQDDLRSSYFKRITPKDIYVDFSMAPIDIYNKVRAFNPWAHCYLKIKNQFLKIGHAQIVNLNQQFFMVKNKKYRMPDVYFGEKAGRVISKGPNCILCTTIDAEHAILLYDVSLFGFCKGFLTKSFIKRLKIVK